MDGKISRDIYESMGVKQGRNKSSDHYKIYISPLLDSLDKSGLGVCVGNTCVSVSGVADDIYLMSDNQHKLQELINISAKYGKMYRITYGASKTKITIIGSEVDNSYFSDISPWIMDNETVEIVENNEHLGQIVSNVKQTIKNVDRRIEKARNSLFGLLGAGFAYKSFLSPAVKLQLYRKNTVPIL